MLTWEGFPAKMFFVYFAPFRAGHTLQVHVQEQIQYIMRIAKGIFLFQDGG